MVTIFTPVYNRAYIIKNLYRSLERQTDHRFEWVIVDDGSTDNLSELVKQWLASATFPIQYQYTENGGKHRAINLGVRMAHYEAFFIVDSDDFLSDDAVEFINRNFSQIEKVPDYAGISGLRCSYLTGSVIGQAPEKTVNATNLERGKYGLQGDKAEVFKTSVLKRYPFPEFENEKFLTESIVWDRIAHDGLKIRWFNKIIYYCEYLGDGLTRNISDILINNPHGWAAQIRNKRSYLCEDPSHMFVEMYIFFESMHSIMEREQICHLLEISTEEFNKFQRMWDSITDKIRKIISENNISTLAIYGMGVYGHRLLKYLENVPVKIVYAIDRNWKEIHGIPAYSIEMELPKVDSICITPKNKCDELRRNVVQKMPDAYIWYAKELDQQLW